MLSRLDLERDVSGTLVPHVREGHGAYGEPEDGVMLCIVEEQGKLVHITWAILSTNEHKEGVLTVEMHVLVTHTWRCPPVVRMQYPVDEESLHGPSLDISLQGPRYLGNSKLVKPPVFLLQRLAATIRGRIGRLVLRLHQDTRHTRCGSWPTALLRPLSPRPLRVPLGHLILVAEGEDGLQWEAGADQSPLSAACAGRAGEIALCRFY